MGFKVFAVIGLLCLFLGCIGGASFVGERVEGCLSENNELTKRGPLYQNPQGLSAKELNGTILVVHNFSHNCCHEMQSNSTVNGTSIRIVENFSGQDCKCMCSSTAEYTFEASPGTYTIEVYQNIKGQGEQLVETTVFQKN